MFAKPFTVVRFSPFLSIKSSRESCTLGMVIFQTNHWAMSSSGNTSKVTGIGADFPLCLGIFYFHSCHLCVSLSWRQGVHPGVWQKCTRCWGLCQCRQRILLLPCAGYDTLSISIGTPEFLSGAFPLHSLDVYDLSVQVGLLAFFFQVESPFWLLMPALMDSLHGGSAFDPAPGPCRMSSVNFMNRLSVHEGCCKVRPDPSHLVLHGLNPWTIRQHCFYYL